MKLTKRLVPLSVVLALVAASAAAAAEVELNGHTFTLPDGFVIEVVASSPLVDRPIVAAFDDQGRLYVADSSGSNDKVDKQLAERPHRIVRLEDTDGDGRFDKSIVFADQMMFPEGAMWFDGSLYVAAPPSIWKLTDTDGDGVADQREEWFPGKTLTGCANDLHGPYLGPDGWIYWCKGAFAKQTYQRDGKTLRVIPDLPNNILGKPQPAAVPSPESANGGDSSPTSGPRPSQTQGVPPAQTWSTRASHIFRCRPDGSGLEVVMTGGMDNPVDVVFTPGGERIFTTTFFVHPGGGRRDGLIHAVYGGVYGKVHDVIEEHKRTGDVMPVLAHLGAAAPCGLARYESRVFGSEYQDNLFACCFNMHKVTRHVLEPDGATFKTRDEDFVVSNNLDFHPTDALEDADGSLIVIDTGGWYKLCCPTSQLHKPDVLGAIYRVRRADASSAGGPRLTATQRGARWQDARGLKFAWSTVNPTELAALLGDERPAVRNRAVRELAKRGKASIPALSEVIQGLRPAGAELGDQQRRSSKGARSSPPPAADGVEKESRINAVWSLTQIDHSDARAVVRTRLADPDETVRQAAIHSVSLWRDHAAIGQLLDLLKSEYSHNRRAAAEALGRMGDKAVVPALLAATGRSILNAQRSTDAHDRVLEHSLTYALIEIADPSATAAGLHSTNAWTRRAALIALSEMDGGGLEPQTVAPLLTSADPVLKETASWIVSRHADWGGALAGFLRQRLARADLSDADRSELARQLARFARNESIQELLATTLRDRSMSRDARQVALQAMRDANLKEKELPNAWIAALSGVLSGDDAELAQRAVSTARALPMTKENAGDLAAALRKIAERHEVAASVRLEALAAVPGGPGGLGQELFDFVLGNLNVENPVTIRSAAAEVLSKAQLNSVQLEALTDSLHTAGPLEVDRLLAAFEQSADETVGLRLVGALKGSPALANLRADSLKTHLAKFTAPVQEQAQELYAAINVDLAQQKERLEELLASLGEGDIRRGQAVFMSPKAACASCHTMGYLGGNIGPDLTRIGGIRADRDLLEAIAFPSASFVRSYEPVVVATRDGKVYSGVLRKDAPDEVVLATSATEEPHIARSDIEEMRPGTVSVMPSGLDQQLTRQELSDLVAFLKAAK